MEANLLSAKMKLESTVPKQKSQARLLKDTASGPKLQRLPASGPKLQRSQSTHSIPCLNSGVDLSGTQDHKSRAEGFINEGISEEPYAKLIEDHGTTLVGVHNQCQHLITIATDRKSTISSGGHLLGSIKLSRCGDFIVATSGLSRAGHLVRGDLERVMLRDWVRRLSVEDGAKFIYRYMVRRVKAIEIDPGEVTMLFGGVKKNRLSCDSGLFSVSPSRGFEKVTDEYAVFGHCHEKFDDFLKKNPVNNPDLLTCQKMAAGTIYVATWADKKHSGGGICMATQCPNARNYYYSDEEDLVDLFNPKMISGSISGDRLYELPDDMLFKKFLKQHGQSCISEDATVNGIVDEIKKEFEVTAENKRIAEKKRTAEKKSNRKHAKREERLAQGHVAVEKPATGPAVAAPPVTGASKKSKK